jgi:hypothetical protein
MVKNNRREFIVIFGKSAHWTGKILNKSISHVMVVSLSNGFWLKLDPTPQGLETEVSAFNEDTLKMLRKMDDIRALKVSVHRSKSYFAKLGVMTCTDVAQYILGLHFRWCWTPYQLYKRLLKLKYDSEVHVQIIR